MTQSESMGSFYVSGGTLCPDAPSYVERQADKDLLRGMLRGDFCYVLTSRQMGKSSLMARTAKQLREGGVNVVVLDLTAIGQNVVPEQWYDGLMARMGRQLHLEDELEQFWRENQRFSPVQRLFEAIRRRVLARKPEPLVIFIDEIDTVRSLPFSTDEFFAAIRECYNRRTEDPEFNRLTFCLLGVATPSDLIQETRLTPFNIGRRIELHDFTPAEAEPLARGLEATAGKEQAAALLERVLYWTGGHPYLTQRLCQALAGQARPGASSERAPAGEERRTLEGVHQQVDFLCAELFFSNRARERDDNLIFVREHLLRAEVDRAGLLQLYGQVQRGRRVRDDETDPLVTVLRLAGVVRLVEERLLVRNRIYGRVFDQAWVRMHMPDAEVQRQRAAYFRGVIRTGAIAAVVVAILTFMVVIAVSQADKARKALAASYFSQAQLRRGSGLAGQRSESLHHLREALRSYPDKAALRDETIACLALVDLRRDTNSVYRNGESGVSALNLDRGVYAVPGEDGAITLHRMADGQVWKSLQGNGRPIKRLRFSGERTLLLAEYEGGSSPELIIWDWQTGDPLFTFEHAIHAEAVDFSLDGGKLALGLAPGRLVVYSLRDGGMLWGTDLSLRSGLPRAPHAIRFDPAGGRLAESSLGDQFVQIWDLRGASNAPSVRLFHADVVHDIFWHPCGERLATACADAKVYLWDARGLAGPVKLTAHEGPVTALAFCPQGDLLASLGGDETIRLWIPATGQPLTLRLDAEGFTRLDFGTDGRRLIASGPGASSGTFEVSHGECRALSPRIGTADRLRTLDFSPDGRLLMSSSGENATFWDAGSGLELGGIHFSNNSEAAWFAADSRHLVTSTPYGLFSFSLGFPAERLPARVEVGAVERIEPAGYELGAMSFSPDRRLAAVAHGDEILLVGFGAGQTPALRSRPVGLHFHRLALHPHGTHLATMVQNSGLLHLWNLQKEPPPAASEVPLPCSEFFAFSPDGKWLITCWAALFEFYQVGNWTKPKFTVRRKFASDQYAPIAVSRDGALVALTSSRYTIQLFQMPGENNPGPPRPVGTLAGPERSPFELMTFSPEGRRLAAVTKDQIVRLWDLALLRSHLAEMGLAEGWPEFP